MRLLKRRRVKAFRGPWTAIPQELAGSFRHSHNVGSLVGLTGVVSLVLGVVLDSTSDDNGAVGAGGGFRLLLAGTFTNTSRGDCLHAS